MVDRLDLEPVSRIIVQPVYDVRGIRLNSTHTSKFKDFVVWWPGALMHYNKNVFQPKVAILIRAIDVESGKLGEYFQISSNVTDLIAMPVGYVFRLSEAGSAVRYQRVIFSDKKFNVDFSKKGWDFYQIGKDDELGIAQHYGLKEYDDDYFRKAWMVRFKLRDGWSLVIPCIEIFSKTYGHSSVIKRNLMIYDIKEFEKRVFKKFSWPLTSEGKRQIYPTRNIIQADYQFLSAYQYEVNTTQKIVRRLVADRFAFFTGPSYCPKIAPWHESPATLKVKYLVVRSTKTIIGLEIIGHSYPDGPDIVDLRPREVQKKAQDNDESDQLPSGGHQVYQQPKLEVDLNQEEAPDKSSNVVTVKIGAMEHYNRANVIKSTEKKESKETEPGTKTINEVDNVSNDVPQGTGKGVGRSNTYAEDAAKNPGTVLELWSSLLAVHKEQSEKIVSVQSYTIKKGYQCKTKPRLQSLKAKISPSDKRGWFYLKERDQPRGILVAKYTDENNSELYWVSIQRRTQIKGNREKETEGFGGLVFKLNKGKKIKKAIKRLQKKFVKDGVRRLSPELLDGIADDAHYFKHMETKTGTVKFRSLIQKHIKNYL